MTSEKVCVAREKNMLLLWFLPRRAGFLASAKTEEEDIYFCKAKLAQAPTSFHIKNDESPHLKLTD